MLRRLSGLLLSLICCSCDVDYAFDAGEFNPRVVVNALLTPQEPFTVNLHWSRSYSDRSGFSPVAEAEIRLYENDTEVLRCKAAPDGMTPTAFRPAAGRAYRLEVSVPDYGELTAQTVIPQAPACGVSLAYQKGWYRHFDMTNVVVNPDARAVWIRGTERDGDRDNSVYAFYTTSIFVDQVNGANNAHESEEKGSTIDFEFFMRIARENLDMAFPLHFSVFGAAGNRHTFQIIAASDSYDCYMRSRYKNGLNAEDNAHGNPFIEQIAVYSNIDNGLGIFAGYNYYTTPEL